MLNGLLLALLFGLLLPLAGRSQTRPPHGAAPADSATAIKRLFRLRRQGSELGLAVGCGAMAPGAGISPTEASQMLMPPCAVAGLGTNCSLLTLFRGMRFSPKREQQVLQRLALHQALPGYVQRALNPVLASN